MSDLFIIDHPLVQSKLALLRDKNTNNKEFRELVSEVSGLLAYEATRDMEVKTENIETPFAPAEAKTMDKEIGLVPILRAGIGMVDGIVNLIPNARVGHIGLYRDPNTLMPIEYYCKLPEDCDEREVFVVDPMLATGGSSIAAIQMLKDRGVKNIRFMCIIAAPEGLKRLHEAHPDVQIYCGSLDRELNENAYICPGLGDAGDRIFGTK